MSDAEQLAADREAVLGSLRRDRELEMLRRINERAAAVRGMGVEVDEARRLQQQHIDTTAAPTPGAADWRASRSVARREGIISPMAPPLPPAAKPRLAMPPPFVLPVASTAPPPPPTPSYAEAQRAGQPAAAVPAFAEPFPPRHPGVPYDSAARGAVPMGFGPSPESAARGASARAPEGERGEGVPIQAAGERAGSAPPWTPMPVLRSHDAAGKAYLC